MKPEYIEASRQMLARAIAEAAFEQSLAPRHLGDGRYRLELGEARYDFRARAGAWQWLWIEEDSLVRNGEPGWSVPEFLCDAREALGLSDIVLGNLIDEVQRSLQGALLQRRRLAGYPARELAGLSGPRLQGLLDGHPKFIANRGRLGWGLDELERYAPEAGRPFRLRWLAVAPELCNQGKSPDLDWPALWAQSLGRQALDTLLGTLAGQGKGHYLLLPVHPWQWQHCLIFAYGDWLADGRLLDLGEHGARYRPQLSIRTLSHDRDPGACDLKLALTILNTSCYRGIPGKHIGCGAALSDWLASLAGMDPELHGLIVQRELAGLHCPQPDQARLPGTPYRYNEMLGTVWRESLEAELGEGEQSRLLAAFMQRDLDGNSLIAEHIRRSGLTAEAWLERLFEVATVPLYHLMCRYGVGLVAHGQNLAVILKDHVPVRAAIKDFHGDLRLWSGALGPDDAAVSPCAASLAGLPDSVLPQLTQLPAAYLVHDLITGHMVTTLRFISPLLERELGFTEADFYALLARVLRRYQARQPALAERFKAFDLFTPTLARICLNKVRYRIGYDDSAERPLPALGTPLPNPLVNGDMQ
ncbi:IucA/IucC family protein [Gallaecimonas sp. GXIMD4217]|uniref:IucA/IucC family protein n=1 Tax=Gallaecimonas sp. GXIMD4217 TaxID=3131927 RepID=UPI00311B2FA3